MNNIVNRRRVYDKKPEPQDTVNVYNYTSTVPSGDYKSSSPIWFDFKSNVIYELNASIVGVTSQWRIDFLPSVPTIISGDRNNWSGDNINFTFKVTGNTNRFVVYVAHSTGHTATIRLTETIPAT